MDKIIEMPERLTIYTQLRFSPYTDFVVVHNTEELHSMSIFTFVTVKTTVVPMPKGGRIDLSKNKMIDARLAVLKEQQAQEKHRSTEKDEELQKQIALIESSVSNNQAA